MYKTPNKCSPLQKNPIVEKSLDLRLRAQRARNFLKWGAINIVLFYIFYYDICNSCRMLNIYWYWFECVVLSITALSSIACFGYYFVFLIRRKCVFGTNQQKYLLFKGNDNSFLLEPIIDEETKEDVLFKEEKDDSPIIDWHSSFEDSYRNYNLSSSYRRSPSPSPTRGMQQHYSQHIPYNVSMNESSLGNNSLNASALSNDSTYMSSYVQHSRYDFIHDERTLNCFLDTVRKRETNAANVANFIKSINATATVNSFWNCCNTAAHMLKTSIYQLAPQQTSNTQHKQVSNDDGGAMQFLDTNSEMIKRISTDKLSQYVANLRMWISATILQRLVKEFENVDAMFRQRGLSDIQIGAVGLERLRKTAENQQFVSQYIPLLPALLPFLDMCINQEYLVQRIKDLAQGSCIADYRWNSGGDYNGQKWAEHLPTDSAILFHLICVYFDSQLMPLPQGGGRPFYSRYVVIRKENRSIKDTIASVHNKAHCAILCSNPMSPKFNFISENELHNCAYNRNNLFYVIIQFLIHMRIHQDSTLEGVNLGKSGINIMCVIED